MITALRPIVFALAKLGMSHDPIAQSFGLAISVLRLSFCSELLQAAIDLEIEALGTLRPTRGAAAALFHLKHLRPQPQKPAPAKPEDTSGRPRRSSLSGLRVVLNDGEPNFD